MLFSSTESKSCIVVPSDNLMFSIESIIMEVSIPLEFDVINPWSIIVLFDLIDIKLFLFLYIGLFISIISIEPQFPYFVIA